MAGGSDGPGGDTGRRNWLAILRIFVGFCFINASLDKFNTSFYNGLGSTLKQFAGSCEVLWYKNFLVNVVIPNAKIFAFLIAIGEFFIGLALILGFITGLFAIFGIILNLNYYMATSGLSEMYGFASFQTANLLFIVSQLVLIFTCAGRTWGCDKYLSNKILFKYLL